MPDVKQFTMPDNTTISCKDTEARMPTFTEAATRSNIVSGESLSTLFGKIKKFFTDLKTVAFTGSYNDLSNTPTIPTVNNGTLTIQRNGTTVATFTANQSTATTANIIDNNTTYSAGTGLSLSSTTFSVKYGTTSGTACQGNDSRVTNTQPAKGYRTLTCANNNANWAACDVPQTATGAKITTLSPLGSANISVNINASFISGGCAYFSIPATNYNTIKQYTTIAYLSFTY